MKFRLIQNKKSIHFFLIIIVILIVTLTIVCINNSKKTKDEDVEDYIVPQQEEYIAEWSGKIKDVTDLGDYYIIKNTLNKFYSNYSYMYTEDNSDKYFSEVVMGLLSEQYINENEITIENITEKFEILQENEVFIINAYNVSDFENEDIFIVDCIVREKKSGKYFRKKILILCDMDKNSFCIYPNAEKMNIQNLNVGENFDVKFDINIQNNLYNSYGSTTKTFDDYNKDIFESYRKMLLYFPEIAYELLDDDFKSQEFSTFENFKNFIENNRVDIFLMTYSYFDSNIEGEITNFISYDKNDIFYLKYNSRSLTNIKYVIKKFI